MANETRLPRSNVRPRGSAPARLGASVVAAALVGLVAPVGYAQVDGEPAVRADAEPPARPRLDVALGMGVTRDSTGFVDRGTASIPSFRASAGAHGTAIGVDVALLAVSASGRFPFKDSPVDRLGFEALVCVRPLAKSFEESEALGRRARRYLATVARSLRLAAGPGYERVAAGTSSLGRVGLATEASVDALSWTDTTGSTFGLRALIHRFWGPAQTLNGQAIRDSHLDIGLAMAVDF